MWLQSEQYGFHERLYSLKTDEGPYLLQGHRCFAVQEGFKLDVRLVSLSVSVMRLSLSPYERSLGWTSDQSLCLSQHALFVAKRGVGRGYNRKDSKHSEKVKDNMANTVVSFSSWFPTEPICDGNFPAISAFIMPVLILSIAHVICHFSLQSGMRCLQPFREINIPMKIKKPEGKICSVFFLHIPSDFFISSFLVIRILIFLIPILAVVICVIIVMFMNSINSNISVILYCSCFNGLIF